jgi:hypothetical protein
MWTIGKCNNLLFILIVFVFELLALFCNRLIIVFESDKHGFLYFNVFVSLIQTNDIFFVGIDAVGKLFSHSEVLFFFDLKFLDVYFEFLT